MITYILQCLVLLGLSVLLCRKFSKTKHYTTTYAYFTYASITVIALFSLIVSLDFSRAILAVGFAFTFLVHFFYEIYDNFKKGDLDD